MDEVIVEGLSYAYREKGAPVLDNISFQLHQGEIAALVGLSGCGKSTLCLCLNGIIPHFLGGKMGGGIRINGKNTRQFKVAELAREVGLVFQDPDTQLFSPTVEDEIAFAPENMCLPPALIREKVDAVLDVLGIRDLRLRNPNRLSGGEKKLVALGAVLALDPRVLVLDEVMAELDAGEKKRIWGILEYLREKGKAILIVEHDLATVAGTDRMLVLEKGSLIRSGATGRLLSDRNFFTDHLLFEL